MKNFEKNGSEYKMKPQLGTYVPLVGFFLLLTIVGFIKIPESSFKWWMLGIVIILVVSLLRSFLFIDMEKKEIRVRKGLWGREIIIPLDTLQGFTIHKVKQYGLITINVSLLARYVNEKGKDKEIPLAQSFFTGPIQHVLNDIDEILGDEYQR